MQNFMPWHGLIGGVMIGLAAAFYLLVVGRTAGISGMVEEAMAPSSHGFVSSSAFLVGLPLGAFLVSLVAPSMVPDIAFRSGAGWLVAAGLLVGFGARIGGGCTSGHGVCGIPRLAVRSIVATSTFMGAAAVTVVICRHLV